MNTNHKEHTHDHISEWEFFTYSCTTITYSHIQSSYGIIIVKDAPKQTNMLQVNMWQLKSKAQGKMTASTGNAPDDPALAERVECLHQQIPFCGWNILKDVFWQLVEQWLASPSSVGSRHASARPLNSNARTREMAKEKSKSRIPNFPGLVLFCIDTSHRESSRIIQHFSKSTRLLLFFTWKDSPQNLISSSEKKPSNKRWICNISDCLEQS